MVEHDYIRAGWLWADGRRLRLRSGWKPGQPPYSVVKGRGGFVVESQHTLPRFLENKTVGFRGGFDWFVGCPVLVVSLGFLFLSEFLVEYLLIGLGALLPREVVFPAVIVLDYGFPVDCCVAEVALVL